MSEARSNHALAARALPPSLVEIANVAGLAAATALARAKGGRRVYIPAKAGEGHWLVSLIGGDAARKLGRYCGGDYVVIPATLTGEAQRRRDAIDRLTDEGASVSDIAAIVGVDRTTVQRRRAARRKQAA